MQDVTEGKYVYSVNFANNIKSAYDTLQSVSVHVRSKEEGKTATFTLGLYDSTTLTATGTETFKSDITPDEDMTVNVEMPEWWDPAWGSLYEGGISIWYFGMGEEPKDYYEDFKNDITAIRDKCGTADLVIIMPYTVADILDSTDKLQRQINVGTFRQGNVDIAVKTFNGSPIIRVPSDRMYSEYTFNDGKAGFGFTKTEAAKLINWIICPRNVPIAVSKTDGVKIFDPATTQGADAWTIEYRKFHDLWVKDKQLPTIRVSVAE